MKNISRIFFAIVILTWAVGNAFAGGEENIVVGDSATEWQQLQVLEDKIWEDKDENSAPDLVFLDVEMPNGNGFTLLSSFDQVNFEEHFSQL
ncbi:MAG: hypothetical protein KKA07_03585, partial [Bacteroidetes bacterium]|nr:hypothetical protein [Bacteroidota bacterium]MBU1718135.1 hypothetical protein [Bacteroidota bacterium]